MGHMRAHRRVPVLATTLAGILLGAGAAASAAVPAQQVVATGQEGLRLTLTLDRDQVPANEAIPVHATVEYVGPGDSLVFDAPGWGYVTLALREQYGTRNQEASFNLDCADHVIRKGEVQQVPLSKSVSWSSEAPDAAFWEAYAHDPELHLPPGQWFIDAVAWYAPGSGCDSTRRFLSATVSVLVTGPVGAPTPTPGASPGA